MILVAKHAFLFPQNSVVQLRNGLNCSHVGFQDGWHPKTVNCDISLSPLWAWFLLQRIHIWNQHGNGLKS